jgi:hypothetical protein
MYLLTIKDGLVTRHVGPYPSPKQASDDLERVLTSCSDRARWQIHALECPGDVPFGQVAGDEQRSMAVIAS